MMSQAMHYIFVPTQESPAAGRVIMRDGETAHIRPAMPEDAALFQQFFASLSDHARFRRFFTVGAPLGGDDR